MGKNAFKGHFTQQAKLPNDALRAAAAVLDHGRLHRYNTKAGETSEVATLEQEFAAWQETRYCLACSSCGQAIQIALRAAGVSASETVLTNAFTLAPVPGAINAVGALPVFIEINKDLVLDLDDLTRKAKASKARWLLLSHMRGHLTHMQQLMQVAKHYKLTVIEDCAHTMGARWNGQRSGNFGLAGCFSSQTYKHLNSGEGGFLISNDPEFMARAIILSGSYMLYKRHNARPANKYFTKARFDMPNLSARMDNLRAAILRPQLAKIEKAIATWNNLYIVVSNILQQCDSIVLPIRSPQADYVGSSIQFRISALSVKHIPTLLARLKARGVELKWFGRSEPHGFTSSYHMWHYANPPVLPMTDAILATLFDMRLPLTFNTDDCALIARIIIEEISTFT